MAEYIEREELARFLRNEIVECETALNNMETPYEHQLEEEAVSGRMQAMVDVWRKVINKAPADVVEVKHGYWKEPNGGGYQCTVCRSFFDNYYGFDAKDRCFYCPTCGAKMDVKEGANNEAK